MAETTTTTKRIPWIDFAKVVSITLVVLGHIPLEPSVTKIIYAFHIPFFFFLSGLLDKNRSIMQQLRNATKTLLIPYVLLYLVYYPLWLFVIFPIHPELFGSGMTWENICMKPFLGLLFGNGYHTGISSMICFPLWFLPALFVAKMLHAVLLKLSKGNSWIYFLGVCLLVTSFLLINGHHIDLYFSIDSALLAFPFFAAGSKMAGILANTSSAKVELKENVSKLAIALLLFITLIGMSPLMGFVDIDHSLYGPNIGLFFMLGFLGISSMVLLSQWYNFQWKPLAIVANGTILILTFHGWFFKLIFRLTGIRGGDIYQGGAIDLWIAIGVSVVTVISMIPLILVVKKYFPILLGGRK